MINYTKINDKIAYSNKDLGDEWLCIGEPICVRKEGLRSVGNGWMNGFCIMLSYVDSTEEIDLGENREALTKAKEIIENYLRR